MISSKDLAVQKVKSTLQQRRYDAEVLAEKNLQKAFENSKFKTNYEKLKDLTWEIGKLSFQKKDISKLQNEYDKIENENISILKKMELSPSSLQPQYSCKKCQDKGIVNGKPCSCFNELLSKELLEESGVSVDNNFKNVNVSLWDNTIKNHNLVLFDQMKEYSSQLQKNTKKLVTLCGKTGVGKTFLSQCMVNESISRGNYTIFISAFELNQQFLTYHCSNITEKANILDPFLSCDFLVVDDLGTENILKNVTREYLYLVISERLSRGKNTMLTTNLMPNNIFDVYDERIYSRITDKKNALILQMEGTDIRRK